MTVTGIDDWVEECQSAGGFWYVKRLSGNDTQATGSHQAGPYIPREDAFRIFPELNRREECNPREAFRVVAASHGHTAEASMIWYNNKLFGGTRNETRITNLGGRNSPLLNRNNTGAVALFFFTGSEGNRECRYWVCRDELEEDTAETFAGPVEPGRLLLWNTAGDAVREAASGRSDADCSLDPQDMPPSWFERFPSPLEIFETALELRPYSNLPTDSRLVRRRNCEYAVFRSVERAAECDVIRRGFDSIDSFIRRAQTILQRRKSRSGRSLELHLKTILSEENVPYAFQPTTETRRKPDFIFPSQEAYDDTSFPASRLKLLAVKTTVRERWRQVLEEASRVSTKHLLTLQEGVSENQFAQMRESGLQLVVPRSLHSKYPPSVVPQLITLQDFVNELRAV